MWIVLLDAMDDRMLSNMGPTLEAEERARAARFRLSSHRRQYIAAHGLKQKLLSASVPHVPAEVWRFQPGRYGKPHVENHAGLEFNLTHCDGLFA